jgi:hypothetical protein
MRLLVQGMEPGSIVSASPAKKGGRMLSKARVPSELIEELPGGVKKSEYGAFIRSWPKWPDWAKQELRDHFASYELWTQTACPLYAEYAASGFTVKPAGFDAAFSSLTDLDPDPVDDPPVNLQPDDPSVEGVPFAMLESDDAFALYVRLVAAQLAMEMGGCLPWSVTDYAPADLAPLFDGRVFARYVPAGPSYWGQMTATGHVIMSAVTPAPPLVVLGFLGQNGLIGADRQDTLTRVLHWEREHLYHVIGGTPDPPLPNGVVYWGYDGRTPVSRMINGTIMAVPIEMPNASPFFDPEVRHWVGGCAGASGFNADVLRVVNVAAHRTSYAHFQNRFALDNGVHVGIAHGDDPYTLVGSPEIPTGDLPVDDATFHTWYVNEPDVQVRLKYVARRTADLNIQYLPLQLVKKHCMDVALGNDHANSIVFHWAFSTTYTVAELEALGLWTGLDGKAASLGGCAAIGF